MPNKGGRKIADHFNRKHAVKSNMTVGKTYVYETLKKHQYEILILKRNIKHRRPKPLPKNKVWGLDLTTVTDENKHQNTVLGIIDYGTRLCLTLENLKDKSSFTLLSYLYQATQKYGKPQKIITDNEAVFNSNENQTPETTLKPDTQLKNSPSLSPDDHQALAPNLSTN